MFRFEKCRIFLLVLASLGTTSAHALPFYFEFGGTLAKWTNPNAVFQSVGAGSGTSATSAYGIPMTLGLQLQNHGGGILFAAALQQRYLSGTTSAGQSFTVMSTSPLLRIEFWKIVLGAGYTPYIAKNIQFKRAAHISSALTLEAQLLFPITPEIDFGLQASQVRFTTKLDGSAGGSASSLEYGAFFRLNFGFNEAAKTERKKYKGWRYPYGTPL